MVGDWIYEVEALMEPGKPKVRFTGKESVRSLGGIWIIAEGSGEMPGGEIGYTVLTLGYDPQKQRYVGTWVGSMMTYLWLYEGSLDGARKVLTLDSEGPNMAAPGTLSRFQDIIEIKSKDHRILTSRMLGADGQWQEVMTAHYRKV
jgi:hypothetical protein